MRKAFVLAAVMTALLCGCAAVPAPSASPETPSLVNIGGIELTPGEMRYLVAEAAGMGSEEIDWDGTVDGVPARRFILDEALSMAVSSYTTGVKAAELGFSLTDEEKSEIEWEITLYAEYKGGREAFLAWLSDSGLTEERYRFYNYEAPLYQKKMIEGLYGPGGIYEPGEQTERTFFSEHYLSASYIYILGVDDHGEPLTGELYQTQKNIADALRRQAVAGEDFTELVETHGQDYLMSLSPEGRTVPRGELSEAAESALTALAEGGISETVEADGGFYILKRLPIDWEWFEKNREDVWYICAEDAYYRQLAEWSAAVETRVSDEYYRLDPQEWIAVG